MIKLEEITIIEFRGIRDYTVRFNKSNFAICGPNGTGKSGIVDAIEFALTGGVSRLVGTGTGGISVKDHGPHVDSRDNPERASVTIKVWIPSLKKSATIHRTVKSATKPTITPADSDILEVLYDVAQHQEFVLSRREMIKFILSKPSDRSEAVQALLRLDKIESLRKSLKKVANEEARIARNEQSTKNRASDDLLRVMGIKKFSDQELLAAANEKRAILSLGALTSLEVGTSLKDGFSSDSAQIHVSKAVLLADIKAAREQINILEGAEFNLHYDEAIEAIANLQKIGGISAEGALQEDDLLQIALQLFDEEHCPVCETEWDPEKFKALVTNKLQSLKKAKEAKEKANEKLENIEQFVENFLATLTPLQKQAALLIPPIGTTIISEYIKATRLRMSCLQKLFPLDETVLIIERVAIIPNELLSFLVEIEEAAIAIPDPTQENAAREYLVAAHERLEVLQQALLRLRKAESRSTLATTVYNLYVSETNAALENAYKEVESSFISLYTTINDDEKKFKAQLIPSSGQLDLDVDFYGRGLFPPGAYHSDGHQDGMGLCLYLALMGHLLKSNFTLAVLDDVLISVDVGHRREVTKMLKDQFPHVQFIMTTHDEIWLRHMKSTGLVMQESTLHFYKWNVELGPMEWRGSNIWKELDDHLDKNDVRSAANLLRHYLEYICQEICYNLRAKVEFRGDAQFTLGDLWPNAVAALKDCFKKGKSSAQSWSKSEIAETLIAAEKTFDDASKQCNIEVWQVNKAVHYNEWTNFNKKDFEPVVAAFKNLLELFSCPSCKELLYITPKQGDKEALRCSCSHININFVKK